MLNEKDDIVFSYRNKSQLEGILIENNKKIEMNSTYLGPLLMVEAIQYENCMNTIIEETKKMKKKCTIIDVSLEDKKGVFKEKIENHQKKSEYLIITNIEDITSSAVKSLIAALLMKQISFIVIASKEKFMSQYKTYGLNSILKFIKPYDIEY